MDMRQALLSLCAGLLGGVAGSAVTHYLNRSPALQVDSIVTRELQLRDAEGRVRARLFTQDGQTTLALFDKQTRSPSIELSAGGYGNPRRLTFFGAQGGIVAALNSLAPWGEATVYLGDERAGTRLLLGSIRSDVESVSGVNEWGLRIGIPGSEEAAVNILARTQQPSRTTNPVISITRANGTKWAIH